MSELIEETSDDRRARKRRERASREVKKERSREARRNRRARNKGGRPQGAKTNNSFLTHITKKNKGSVLPVKVGRPRIYDPDICPELVYRFALLGGTDQDIAGCLGISTNTLHTWKNQYPEFEDAMYTGKDVADAQVASKLFARAVGYDHDDTHISNFQGEITKTQITKHYPPEPKAGIYWLNNRKRGKWSSAQTPVEEKDKPGAGKTVILLPPKET